MVYLGFEINAKIEFVLELEEALFKEVLLPCWVLFSALYYFLSFSGEHLKELQDVQTTFGCITPSTNSPISILPSPTGL